MWFLVLANAPSAELAHELYDRPKLLNCMEACEDRGSHVRGIGDGGFTGESFVESISFWFCFLELLL